jgi:hypothetical protein
MLVKQFFRLAHGAVAGQALDGRRHILTGRGLQKAIHFHQTFRIFAQTKLMI